MKENEIKTAHFNMRMRIAKDVQSALLEFQEKTGMFPEKIAIAVVVLRTEEGTSSPFVGPSSVECPIIVS